MTTSSPARVGSSAAVPGAGQFVALDRLFDLERAGPIVRIWCRGCDKHQVLAGGGVATVEAARESHCCGPRTSGWGTGAGR